jgi:DNA topoisomerase-1
LLNFYRLVDVGPRLPRIRSDVAQQLRRRTVDCDSVLAAMIRIVDSCGLRVGSEEYAEENDSYGLSTLTPEHVSVAGGVVQFDFPAKSGKQAQVHLADRAVARIITRLLETPGERLFTVGGAPISADDLNARLGRLAGARVTAKDFRTWHGTRVSFASLRQHLPPGDDRDQRVLNAIDAAADFLNNTRAVARSHYVHPHVVQAYVDGTFEEIAAARRPPRAPGLDSDERALLGFLATLLEMHLSAVEDAPRPPAALLTATAES